MSSELEQPARKALDGGVLIALAVGEAAASELKDEILKGETLAFCSELALAELEYILCRRLGWNVAEAKSRSLVESKVVGIIETSVIMHEAAKMKCERALSLPDCFTLALSKLYHCKAIFVRKEVEMEQAIEKKAFDVEIKFLMP